MRHRPRRGFGRDEVEGGLGGARGDAPGEGGGVLGGCEGLPRVNPPEVMGLKWSGCNVRVGLWPRLPHGCYRLLSKVPMFGASCDLRAQVHPSPLLRLTLLAGWAPTGHACIQVRVTPSLRCAEVMGGGGSTRDA